jgi:hypothetical protein
MVGMRVLVFLLVPLMMLLHDVAIGVERRQLISVLQKEKTVGTRTYSTDNVDNIEILLYFYTAGFT